MQLVEILKKGEDCKANEHKTKIEKRRKKKENKFDDWRERERIVKNESD
jgi:hypothetical protein